MEISKEDLKQLKKDYNFMSNVFYITVQYINGTAGFPKGSCNIALFDAGLLLDWIGREKFIYKPHEITNVFLANPYIVIEFNDNSFWVLSVSDKKLKKIYDGLICIGINSNIKDVHQFLQKNLITDSNDNDLSNKIKICNNCGDKLLVKAVKCPYCGKKDTGFYIVDKNDTKKINTIIGNVPHPKNGTSIWNTKDTPITKKGQIKEKVKENKANGIACCPKCGSTSISYSTQKLSVGRAIIGGAAFGGAGAVLGGLSSKKGVVKCLNCGHSWKI